jgi:ribonucleotide reductase beta subunit family protein with ferritin-like domain
MPNVFEGTPDARQSSDETHPVSRFRPTYRALSDEEKRLHDLIKEQAAVLESLVSDVGPSRETSLALTKLEECVMWAIKALTGNRP